MVLSRWCLVPGRWSWLATPGSWPHVMMSRSMSDIRTITVSSSPQPPPGPSLTPFMLWSTKSRRKNKFFCFNCFEKDFVQLYPSLIRARSGSSISPPLAESRKWKIYDEIINFEINKIICCPHSQPRSPCYQLRVIRMNTCPTTTNAIMATSAHP